jgi:hypothetical protein
VEEEQKERENEKKKNERSREDSKIQRSYNRYTVHVEYRNKSDVVIMGAAGTIYDSFREYLINVPGKHEIK